MPLGDSVLSTPVRVIKRQQKLEMVFCSRGNGLLQLNLIVKNPEKIIILSQELCFFFFFQGQNRGWTLQKCQVEKAEIFGQKMVKETDGL